MRKIVLVFFSLFLLGANSEAASRIKDIGRIEGVRENQLFGYGLAVGLNGTGDRQGTAYTIQSIGNMLRRLGVNIPPEQIIRQIRSRNIAAVMVTADLPAFVKSGTRIDVVVSSIGDATNLSGGVLLQTPLQGADGNVYAVAQGQISTGVEMPPRRRGALNVGRIPAGGLVEKEIHFPFVKGETFSIILHQPDFSTAQSLVKTITQRLGLSEVSAEDAATVRIKVPTEYRENPVGLIAKIEALEVEVDMPAKVIINERTGTVVANRNVRISGVAVTHGNITVEILSRKEITEATVQVKSYPPKGQLVSSLDSVTIQGEGRFEAVVLEEGVDLEELVKALNSLGIAPKDLIAILQAIKQAGALQAELIII